MNQSQKYQAGLRQKKISAIMNHDKSKIASLPELKIRTSEAPKAAASQSGAKEMAQKVNGSKSSSIEDAEMNRKKEKVSLHSDGDESTVIEKTVVMLECQKPAISALPSSDETMPIQKEQNDIHKLGKTTEIESDYAAIHPPISSPNKDRIDKEPIQHQIQQQTGSFKFQVETGNMGNTKKESLNLSGIGITEKAYQASYAQVSSLEDPCTENSQYGKGPPTSLQIAVPDTETVNTHVFNANNLRLEKIPEALDMPEIKESKGFRRLLKFGRKNHNPGSSERNVESDNGSFYGSEADDLAINTSSSSEVHTLKNLISQDETPSGGGGTPQKSSRHFSLLSPFKSKKTREKKSTT